MALNCTKPVKSVTSLFRKPKNHKFVTINDEQKYLNKEHCIKRIDQLSLPTTRQIISSGIRASKIQDDKRLKKLEALLRTKLHKAANSISMTNFQFNEYLDECIAKTRPSTPINLDTFFDNDLDRPIFFDTYQLDRDRKCQIYNFRSLAKSTPPLKYPENERINELAKPRRSKRASHQQFSYLHKCDLRGLSSKFSSDSVISFPAKLDKIKPNKFVKCRVSRWNNKV